MATQRTEVVLIGPTAVGKTTVGRCLAERLGIPLVSMDPLRDRYYAELGFDPAFAKRLFELDGAATYWCYCKTFDPHAVERFLQDHRDCVLDMGGGSSVHEHEDNLARVERALAPFANVVLLLPDPDPEASLRFLDARTGWGGKPRNVNRLLLAHPSNGRLARLTVYTADRTPDAIAAEILGRIAPRP